MVAFKAYERRQTGIWSLLGWDSTHLFCDHVQSRHPCPAAILTTILRVQGIYGFSMLQLKSGEVTIRRPELVCSSNKFMRNPNRVQNPKSKRPWLGLPPEERIVQQSKIQIRDPSIRNPNSKSKTQNPNSPLWFWILDDAGGGHVANDDVWPSRPPEFGLGGGRPKPRASRIEHRFPEEVFGGKWVSVSSPASWKSGLAFQRTAGKCGVAKWRL